MTIKLNGKNITVQQNSLLSDIMGLHTSMELPCGGKGMCGKCRVIAHGQLSAPSQQEKDILTPKQLELGVRLACCCVVQGDCVVESSHEAEAQVQVEGYMPSFTHEPMFRNVGVAIDLGTTTLAAILYDKSGKRGEATALNPQARWGADVISRLEKAINAGGQELANSIREGLSQLIEELCCRSGYSPNDVDCLVITGNTAMMHLLTQRDPTAITRAPFESEWLFGEYISAAALDLPCPDAMVYLPRCMSAFVGGDITTAMLASGICDDKATAIMVDIGTNGEVALWHGGELYCCSTAAGPAFEGAGISMGMGGKVGAIRSVSLFNGRMHSEVIGDVPPVGICASGVIDAVACLLKSGRMDETGLLEQDPTLIATPVSITGQDVRMVQLAKSAIYAGIITMVNKAGITHNDVDKLCIAGGFGSHIDLQNATYVGLIPGGYEDKTQVMGNIALSGAAMLLLCHSFVGQSLEIAKSARVMDLAGDPLFANAYVDGMLFEEP